MSRLLIATAIALATSIAVPAEAKNKFCPPGLAKKEVPCVPPGLAKKKHTEKHHDDDHDHYHDHDHEHYHWRSGDRITGEYMLIPRREWERLALRDYRDGSRYIQVDNEIVRVMRDTLTVIEAVRILDRVLN